MIKFTVLLAVFVVASAGAGEWLYADGAWAGASDFNPVNYDPKTLAEYTYADELDNDEKNLCDDDDADWYTYNEPSPGDFYYNWMIFSYADLGTPTTATMVWQVAVDSDQNGVSLYYWHGNNEAWVYVNVNEGGRYPATENDNVKAAFQNNGDAENVIFLYASATPPEEDDYIKCDVSAIWITLTP